MPLLLLLLVAAAAATIRCMHGWCVLWSDACMDAIHTPGESMVPYYLELLQALHPLFSLTSKGTEGGVVDNAAAAVARMIMAVPAAVPMEQVLPVLLSALPLKTDRSENESVYTCLLGLIHLRHPEAMRSLDTILREPRFVVFLFLFRR